jgi:kynureninase
MRERSDALTLDAGDPLAGHRGHFVLPDGIVYLDGNSLGALPAALPARLDAVIHEQWGRDLIRSWNRHDWIDLPVRVGEAAAALIGAGPGQVVAADSTSVNLFKLLAAALDARPGRTVILSVEDNFPTDLYMAQGLARLLGGEVRLRLVSEPALEGAMDEDTAVVMLSHVDFRTGRIRDMAALTAAAHRAGALALWDLAHSAGVLPVALDAAEVDLAVGCGYKYLCGGPGAPAFLYVARRLQDRIASPLSGWMGHVAPFAFDPAYRPAPGVCRFLCGTPAVLAMTALEVGVETISHAGIDRLRAKATALTEYFITLADERLRDHGFELASPRDPADRGAQVSLRHAEGLPIMAALVARDVIGDFREPDILRFGFAPLTTRFVDGWDAVEMLVEIMETRAWDRPEHRRRPRVT